MPDHVRVSIGLPVYNGERYLRDAIASILRQTYADFELIICDNASTDGTEAICRRFAAQDLRIRYYRHPVNLGAARNFNETFALARGVYFKWAAHDDMLEPEFLAACVEALDRHPDAVLAFPRTDVLSQDTGVRTPYDVGLRLDAAGVVERVRRLLAGHQCYELFAVVRRDALARTRLMGPHFAGDAVLLMQLALAGRFVEVRDRLFIARAHDEQCTTRFRTRPYEFAGWYDSSKEGRATFPYWRVGSEYTKAVLEAPLSAGERCACLLLVTRWWMARARFLARDVWFAAVRLAAPAMAGAGRPQTGDQLYHGE
jgi:glycosyltransferase involved in cell wall biosynthesis